MVPKPDPKDASGWSFKHQNFLPWQAPEGAQGPLGFGGYCEVRITTPEGKEVSKSAYTHEYDPWTITYRRRLLTAIALGKATHELKQMGVMG